MVTLVEIGEGQGGGLEERCWRGTGRVKKIVKRSVKIAAGVGRVTADISEGDYEDEGGCLK